MKNYIYIQRKIDISKALGIQSVFLFGARQTGKTSYLTRQMKSKIDLLIDLLDTGERTRLSRNPGILVDEIRALDKDKGLVVIDEIQLVPSLLSEVHRLMESTDFTFLLTGSGVRNLIRSGADMLGGRAGEFIFHPLVWPEIKDIDYSLEHVFRTGLLPQMYLSSRPGKLLTSYWTSYLLTQVQSEGCVRNIPAFSHFLLFAAISSGEQINYSNIANDVGMSQNSIKAWYSILSDMLVGSEIPAFTATKKRKAMVISKYYLFDVGVLRAILNMAPPSENTREYGKFFEHYICHELVAYLDYNGADYRNRGLFYWRTQSGLEVDFVYKDQVAIEVKTTKLINEKKDLRGLRALKDENSCRKYIVVCREGHKRKTEDGIYIYPFETFLEELWSDRIIRVETFE